MTRPVYRGIVPYDVDPSGCDLSLADNTSPFGVPPTALDTLRLNATESLAQYPSTYSKALGEAFARYVGVEPDEVMVGAGSDEVMSCTFRALGEPGAIVAYMDPTFVMARVFAATNSLHPLAVPLNADHDADADALLATQADMIYVCAPNNPTGIQIAAPVLARIIRDATGLLLIDEAYAEYAGTNIAARAPSHGRLLVYRTMSKAFGMAGLRVGFVVGARTLIAELKKARGPYTVSTLSERAALAALQHDVPWVSRAASIVVETRNGFCAALSDAGYQVLPSAANFVMLPVPDASAASQALREKGILVRSFSALPGIGHALRITIGSPAAMTRVMSSIRDVVPCG